MTNEKISRQEFSTTGRTIEVLALVIRILESSAEGLREDGDHDHAEVLEEFAESMANYAEPASADFWGEGGECEREGGDLDMNCGENYPSIEEILDRYGRDLKKFEETGWSELDHLHKAGTFIQTVRTSIEIYSNHNGLDFTGATDEQIVEAISHGQVLRGPGDPTTHGF